ncbi:hypothetical protein PSV08DRAFT_372007 [Bipolaris maydis]|nr:hypothetical protein PSV08DRAFT_372007 [Bipolaris maydis]
MKMACLSNVKTDNQLEPVDDELGETTKPVLMRHEVAFGMESWIFRNGLPCKKTSDGNRWLRFKRDKPGGPGTYTRNQRIHNAKGSLTIHSDDQDAVPGTCKVMIHPPITSELEYGDENGREHLVITSLAKLISGSTDNAFCSIILQGINEFANDWKPKWDELRWNESQFMQHKRLVDKIPEQFPEQPVDAEIMISKFEVRLQVPPISHAGVGRKENVFQLDFYSDLENPSPWKAFPPSPHISSFVLSAPTLDLFRSWINECPHNHKICNTIPNARPPSRLLQINLAPAPEYGIPTLQLFHTSPTEKYTYVAVSHCWSYTRPLKTTAANLTAHLASVPWGSLSPVFRDTVLLCICLGYDYIWIDSLCILQEDALDFAAEAPHMGQIYAQSALVIAAHGPELFFNRYGAKRIIPPPLQPNIDPGTPVFARTIPQHENLFNPAQDTASYWGRAWCFQERLFAQRILHFGGDHEESYFECGEMVDCECQRGLREKIGGLQSTWSHLKSLLPKALRAFDDAVTSPPSNSSHLSKAISPRLGTYYAGLWSHNLLLGLQWEAYDTCKSSHHAKGTYLAPSWSWASRSGGVVWYYYPGAIPTSQTHELAEVLDVQCELATDDPFGPVKAAEMRIKGWTTVMWLDNEKEEISRYGSDGRVRLHRLGAECFVVLDAQDDYEELRSNEEVKCLEIMRDRERIHDVVYASGLVLKRVELEGKENVWKRIGFTTMTTECFGEPETDKVEELVIV